MNKENEDTVEPTEIKACGATEVSSVEARSPEIGVSYLVEILNEYINKTSTEMYNTVYTDRLVEEFMYGLLAGLQEARNIVKANTPKKT